MKNFRLLLASLLIVLFGAFSASAQETKYYEYTGSTSSHPNFMFQIPGHSSTSFINVSGNYGSALTIAPSCESPQQRYCAFKAEVTSGSLPSKQSLIDAIKTKLDALLALVPAQTFSNLYSWTVTIGSVSVTFTIYTKENPI